MAKIRLPLRRMKNESNESYVRRYIEYTIKKISVEYEISRSKKVLKKHIANCVMKTYGAKDVKVKIKGNSVICTGNIIIPIKTISIEMKINGNQN